MRRVLLLAALAFVSSSVVAHADSFSANAISAFTVTQTADTLSFNSAASTFTAPGTVIQTGQLSASTTNFVGTVNFTFQDTLTLDGITKTITISGIDTVTSTKDTVQILAGTPVQFGSLLYSVQAASAAVTSSNLTAPLNLTGTVTSVTPEPSSLALLGTGILGIGGVLRKRLV